MERIICHWTAGGNRASDLDKKHYHRLVEYDGTVVAGTEEIADNIVTSDGDYAAHTRNLNTGSIGVAMCGMHDAQEYPFNAGPSPLTEKQFNVFCIMVADLCRTYSIPVTRKTVLTHAEVEPTLGVRQRGKWDITRLPFKPGLVGALDVGDYMRDRVREILGDAPVQDHAMRPVLRMGSRGVEVQTLQRDLERLGYHQGKVDGIFGQRTRASVLALQADNGLVTDGIVGPSTWATMEKASAAPLRAQTEEGLRASGSRTIAEADKGERQTKVAAVGVGGLGAVQMGKDVIAEVSGAGDLLSQAQAVLVDNWPILLVLCIAAVAYFKGPQVMQAIRRTRVADAVTGRNLGR